MVSDILLALLVALAITPVITIYVMAWKAAKND